MKRGVPCTVTPLYNINILFYRFVSRCTHVCIILPCVICLSMRDRNLTRNSFRINSVTELNVVQFNRLQSDSAAGKEKKKSSDLYIIILLRTIKNFNDKHLRPSRSRFRCHAVDLLNIATPIPSLFVQKSRKFAITKTRCYHFFFFCMLLLTHWYRRSKNLKVGPGFSLNSFRVTIINLKPLYSKYLYIRFTGSCVFKGAKYSVLVVKKCLNGYISNVDLKNNIYPDRGIDLYV